MSVTALDVPRAAAPPTARAFADDSNATAIALRAYARAAGAWKLTNPTAAALIGAQPRTWARMKAGDWTGRLSQDQIMRLSGLIGLYKALHLYFSDELADRWVRLDNAGPPFNGRSPVEHMVEGGLPAILATRGYVDALRGGV